MAARVAQALRRQSLYAFIQGSLPLLTGHGGALNWHVELIAQHLEACAKGEVNRLLITLPPRQLKSVCGSIVLPAWLLGRYPDKRVVGVSYSKEISRNHVVATEQLMTSEYYQNLFPGRQVVQCNASKLKTKQGGFYYPASVNGILTGMGADILILDDPVKPVDAHNPEARAALKEWYNQTLYTRLNSRKSGVIILIMQRLHEDDLAAHVLGQEDWVHLNLPALALNDEIHKIQRFDGEIKTIRRQRGEVLNANLTSKAEYASLQTIMGEEAFDAQYLQITGFLGLSQLISLDAINEYDLTVPESEDEIALLSEVDKLYQVWHIELVAGVLLCACTTWMRHRENVVIVASYTAEITEQDLSAAIKKQYFTHKPDNVFFTSPTYIRRLKAENEDLYNIPTQEEMGMNNALRQGLKQKILKWKLYKSKNEKDLDNLRKAPKSSDLVRKTILYSLAVVEPEIERLSRKIRFQDYIKNLTTEELRALDKELSEGKTIKI